MPCAQCNLVLIMSPAGATPFMFGGVTSRTPEAPELEGQPTAPVIGSMIVQRAQTTNSTAGGFPIEDSTSG